MIYGNGYPVIVSDRAISDRQLSGKVILPTTGKETADSTSVTEFRVKTLIIKEILCVAFAGLVSEIESMRDEIVDFFLYRNVNKETLKKFLDQMPYSKDISVLFALGGPEFENNKVQVACSGQWVQDHSKEKLDIIASGSGASKWITQFIEHENYLQSSGDRLTDCKLRTLLACVKFNSNELHSTDQLQEGWGGGFDVIYYENGRFHRYDEVAYSFLYATNGGVGPIKVISINHNRYENGNAIVLNIDYHGNATYFVVPQFRNNAPVDTDNLVLKCKSSDVVTCIFIKKDDDTLATIVVLMKEWDELATPMFLATELNGTFQYVFKPSYSEMVKESLQLYFE